MLKVTFVILHFLTYKETFECVESIINVSKNNNVEIVIVDNCSNNGSFEKLTDNYYLSSNIHLITLDSNLGFAKGNNVGFKYAKEILKTDIIVMLNNDTILEQDDFIEKIIHKYNISNFDIMGPDIVSLIDSAHQNPQDNKIISYYDLIKKIKKTKRLIISNKVGYIYLVSVIRKIKYLIGNKIGILSIQNNWIREQKNIQLHGSCLIFSPNYIKKFNGLFSGTFMYGEEEILSYISYKENLKTIYWPGIKVMHKEDSSTNSLFIKGSAKRNFLYRNSLKSMYILKKIMENNQIYKNDIYDIS